MAQLLHGILLAGGVPQSGTPQSSTIFVFVKVPCYSYIWLNLFPIFIFLNPQVQLVRLCHKRVDSLIFKNYDVLQTYNIREVKEA